MRDYSKDSTKLFEVMSSKSFLNSTSIGGETPVYIYSYEVEATDVVEDMLSKLKKRLGLEGVRLLHIDLFEAFITYCKDSGYLDWMLEAEEETSKEEFLENVQGIAENTGFAENIGQMLDSEEYDVFVLTGAGKIYPLLRMHSMLEKLQKHVEDHPLVLFFPGEYIKSLNGGISLSLFARLNDDNYYRAFDILKEA